MRRLGIPAMFLASVLLANCGGFYFVGFVSNPVGTRTVSGVVSTVASGFVSDPSGLITPVTTVTFSNAGIAITLTFCGEQEQSFPINQNVHAEYTIGVSCNILLNVVIGNIENRDAHSSPKIIMQPTKQSARFLVHDDQRIMTPLTVVLEKGKE